MNRIKKKRTVTEEADILPSPSNILPAELGGKLEKKNRIDLVLNFATSGARDIGVKQALR